MSLMRFSNSVNTIKNALRANQSEIRLPWSRVDLELALQLYKKGFASRIREGNNVKPDEPDLSVEVTPENIASRCIWLTMKYKENQPVLRDIQMVSKPSNRIVLDPKELKAVATGLYVRKIKPLKFAESMLVLRPNEKTLVDIQEAAMKQTGGLVACRFR